VFLILSANLAYSQELEPRNYSVIPKNLNGLIAGYSLSDGSILTDGTSPITDFDVTTHTITLGGVRTFGIFGKLGKVQLSVPFAFMSGDLKVNGKDTSGTRTGFADARFRLGINIFGSPAMEPKDYLKFKEEMVLGASVVVSIPTGQYMEDKIVNLGSNRWGFKPEIGFSYNYKRFYIELYSGVWFFTPNNEYVKTNTLKQEPILSLQAHTIFTFKSGIWLGLDGNYFWGGQSELNGVSKDDQLRNSRFGGVIGYPINMNHSIKLQAHTGVETAIGQSYTTVSLGYQYIWF
jgi:hypothetical protein